MSMNVAYNYRNENESDSGLKAVPKVESIVLRKRNSFEDAMVDMQSDPMMIPLLTSGSAAKGGAGRGILNFTLSDWHRFTEKYLKNNEQFFDKAGQQQDLAAIFNKSMNQVIKKWPELAAQGYQWESLCASIQKHLLELASILNLRNELAESISNWFTAYREIQENERKYGERDRLAAEALQKHQQLAYLKTTGQDNEEVSANVRIRIAKIDDEISKMPAHPDHQPAFSTYKNRADRAIAPETPQGQRPSAWVEQPPVSTKRPVTGWRAAAKKIPLLGRFF
jgi:hypothetical protein